MHYKRWLRTGSPTRAERPTICSVDDCERQAKSRGWCHAHYQRWRRTGDLGAAELRSTGSCEAEGCHRQRHARGLCQTHYRRLLNRGEVIAEREIGALPRPKGVSRGSKGWTTNGYSYVPVGKEERHLTGGAAYEAEHRLVMARRLGRPLTADENVHHRNGDRMDNRIENLELWSVWQPSGQRVRDKVQWAIELLARYAPSTLVKDPTLDSPD
jgi:hypothetical protein